MSVDTRAYINGNDWDSEDVMDYLRSLCGVEGVRYHDTHMADYHLILFTYNGENRKINCHKRIGILGSDIYGMGADETGKEITRQIAERFGGVWQPHDTRDDGLETFQCGYPDDGIVFKMKWAYAKGYIHSFDDDSAEEAMKKWKEIHG